MIKSRRIISFIMVLLIMFSTLQLPLLKSPQLYAAESVSYVTAAAGESLSTIKEAAYKTTAANISDSETMALDETELPPTPDQDSVQADYYWLSYELVCKNTYFLEITDDLNIPALGENGSAISWTSSNVKVVALDGTVNRPAYTQGDMEIALTATISKGEAMVQKTFYLTVIAMEPTAADRVAADKGWLTNELVLNGNRADDVKTRLYLPEDGEKGGSYISWESSNPDVVTADGTVNRPAEIQGNKPVTLTASISNGDAEDQKAFNIIVTVVEEFPLALKFDDFSNPADSLQFNGISGITKTTDHYENSIHSLQFNNDGSSSGGSVFPQKKLHLNDDMSFSTNFSFRNEHSDYALGDGGFTFTLQADDNTAYGQNLDSLGAEGINPSLSIAFDTLYEKHPGPGQATTYSSTDKVAVFYNGYNDASYENGRSQGLVYGYTKNAANCAWIEYDGQSKKLEIRFSSTEERPIKPTLQVDNVDLKEIFSNETSDTGTENIQDIYAGFTGSVGNANDKTQIWGWYFKNDSTPVDFTPYSFIDASDITLSAVPPAGQSSSTVTALVYGSNSPAVGIAVDFSTTFGSLKPFSAITDSSGKASAILSTPTSGTAVVKAIAAGGAFTSTEVQLAVTDADRLVFDKEWLNLNVPLTLGENLSQYSICHDLSLPDKAPNGSLITWTSKMPELISDSGVVTRPEYQEGHQSVTMTAALTIGDEYDSTELKYTVLSIPDTAPPEIINTSPENNSIGVHYDTRQITIRFSEDIKPGTGNSYSYDISDYGIEFHGPSTPKIYARINKNELIITLDNDMASGENELFIPAGAVSDMSDNPLQEGFRLLFTVESIQLNKIELISSKPEDRGTQFPLSSEISFSYNYDEIVEGRTFDDIALRSKAGDELDITRNLNGDTVTLGLKPGAELKPGLVYEIFIPSGAVQDRFKNDSIAKTILFRTQGGDTKPEVISTSPYNGQNAVDVHQNIEISFSELVNTTYKNITMRDGNENWSNAYIRRTYFPRKSVLVHPYQALQPNTHYTITLPHDAVRNSSDNHMTFDYTMSFTTGENSLSIDKINTGSTAYRGAPINTHVEIEFSSPVSSKAEFPKVNILDSEGNPVSCHTEEMDNKVILTPFSKLSPSETYTVKIPAGAYINENNDLNDALMYKFATAAPLHLDEVSFTAKPSSKYLVNKAITFSTEWIESRFKSAGYQIDSWEWTFGDGRSGSGKSPEHSYNATGDYQVKLSLKDCMGFSYEFEQIVSIGDYKSANVKITVWPNWHQELILADHDKNDNRNYKMYTINLSYYGKYIPEEKVQVLLYKNNVLQQDFGTVITGSGKRKYVDELGYHHSDYGTAFFPFWYEKYDLSGTYELLFVYGSLEEGRTVRVPVTINDIRAKQTLRIQLYDEDTGKVLDYPHGLFFELDGKKCFAERRWYDEQDGYCYMIDDVERGYHKLKLMKTESVLHYSDYEFIYHYGVNCKTTLAVKGKQPGLNSIKSELSDSDNWCNTLFIQGVDRDPLLFEFDGNWDGLKPGYYEIKINPHRHIKSYEPNIELNPGTCLLPGESLLVRMVSQGGIKSPWMDAKVEVVPRPSFGPEFNINYVDGEYQVDTPMGLKELIGESIPILDDIPLLNNSSSFGLGNDDYTLDGIMDENEHIKLEFGIGSSYENEKEKLVFNDDKKGKEKNRHEKEKKKAKLVSAGYEISADMFGTLFLAYDQESKVWKLYYGEFTVLGDGSYFWKRAYEVPKINIGVDATLTMGSVVGGTFIVNKGDSNEREYSGIIYFSPYINGSIEAGLDWVSVEGYVDGRIASELHIPTGYIQVDPSITAGINANFFFYTQEILNKSVSTHWDNGKEKIPAPSFNSARLLMVDFNTDDVQLTPMSRNYLNRESQCLAGKQGELEKPFLEDKEKSPLIRSMALSYDEPAPEENNPQIEIIKDNIYPQAVVQLLRNEDELWMVWTDDNPERSSMNRTQMRYSVFKDGNWSEPVWIGQDGTADFSPAAASAGNGVLMAWQNIKQSMPEDAELVSFIKNAEISVTDSVYKVNSSDVQMIMLTNDDKFDHSPKLAADSDNALLVWTKSEGLSFTLGSDMETYRSPENSDRLLFSCWNGSSWSTPMEITDSLPTVLNSSLSMHGEKGLLLYTLDMDNEQSTQADREIFARIYDGSSWGEEIRITDNAVSDSNPQAVCCNGEWFITWHQDGSIMYKEGLNGEIKTEEFLGSVQSKYEITVNHGTKPQIALVYKHIGDNNVRSLSTSFYDINNGVWSHEIPLTKDAGYVRSFNPVFTEDGKLNIAYTQAQIITEVIEGVEYLKASDKVDLKTLTYTPLHDLALDKEDDLQFFPEIPLPGTMVKVSAVIRNQGDFAENASLYLYDGNPEEGGMKIGEAATAQPISARSSAQVEIEWLVDEEEKDKYDIFAVVHPEQAVIESNQNNNTISHEILTADIAVTSLEYENLAKDDYLLTAKLANTGSRSLEGIQIHLKHVQSGQILVSKELDQFRPGQEAAFNFLISSHGLTADENGKIKMVLTVLAPDGVNEFSTDNNSCEFVLKPAPIVVDSIDPAQDESQVPIQKPLTIKFNMNVEQDDEFDQIILEDDYLNKIDINKTLNANTLTVTPQTPMAYSTRYTLTIPKGALGDSFGHTMDESYNLSFLTTTSSPEIIFAYPAYGLGNIALDTDIKMQFNQDILDGPAFGDIAMYGPDSKKVSASVSLEGECLYIHPTAHLNENTAYSVIIPRAAVMNDRGEAQQENHTLEFITAKANDSGNNDNHSGSSNNRQSSLRPGADQPAYKISRQIADDGNSTAIIDLDQQFILKSTSDDESVLILDVTDEVKEYEIIRVNLAESALKQLVTEQMGLNILTGKGDIRLPAEFIKSLVRDNKKSITLRFAKNAEKLSDNSRVSEIFDFSIRSGGELLTGFKPEVIVTIPLDMSKVGNIKRVIICVHDEDADTWHPVGGAADAAEGSVVFSTRHFSSYAAFETIKHFDDVTSSWAKEKVEILASRHLIEGKNDNVFAPDDSITRAEFTAMIVRSLYKELTRSKGTFTDVPEDAWFADSVETAYEMGFVNGTDSSKFDPNAQISREQLAAIAYRLYQFKAGTKTTDKMTNTFKDQQEISSYAEEPVNFLANAGIMIGSAGNFEAKRSATRQETAVVLYRLLEYMGEL